MYDDAVPELWRDFLTHSGHPAHKWTHYFPAYEAHFARYQNRPMVFWEIGVGQGGSLQLWKQFFGPYAQIVGLDIEDKHQYEEDQISIRIGDQSDISFLQSVLDEFGTPDVVLDDGSHIMSHVEATFRFLYPRISSAGVYMIEDLHTAYWPEYGGGLHEPASFMEIAKGLIDELNADHARGAIEPTAFTTSTLSMHFYDSIIAFERGRHNRKHAPHTGDPSELPVPPKSKRFSALRPKGTNPPT
jgi:cephalosporin hydroxylase